MKIPPPEQAAAFASTQVSAWSSPPVDGVGYIPSSQLLGYPDEELRSLIEEMRSTRFTGWRNYQNRWRQLMGHEELTGKDIIDWGCGTGLEALELGIQGNRVTVADIVPANVALAARVTALFGIDVQVRALDFLPPFTPGPDGAYDVFYINGVLHHVPWPEAVMERAHQLLRPGGEARVMVYSDHGWRIATGTEPPADVSADPQFWTFVRYFDAVGNWADWYDQDRLEQRFGQWFTVERFSYLTPDSRYCAAVLRRR